MDSSNLKEQIKTKCLNDWLNIFFFNYVFDSFNSCHLDNWYSITSARIGIHEIHNAYKYNKKDKKICHNRIKNTLYSSLVPNIAQDRIIKEAELQTESDTESKVDNNINKLAATESEISQNKDYDCFSNSKCDQQFTKILRFKDLEAIKKCLSIEQACDINQCKTLIENEISETNKSEVNNDPHDAGDEERLMTELHTLGNFSIKTQVTFVYMIDQITQHPQEVAGISWKFFNHERWRLHTYSRYPHSAKKSAILLAQAGFVYYGSSKDRDDSVICYFCCASKRNWCETDDIFYVHKSLSPNCSMVTGLNCSNIPMTVPGNATALLTRLYNSIETNEYEENNTEKEHRRQNANEIECDNAHSSHSTDDRNSLAISPTQFSESAVSRPMQMANQNIIRPNSVNTSPNQEAVQSAVTNSQSVTFDAPSSSNPLHSSSPTLGRNLPQTASYHQGNSLSASSAVTTALSSATATAGQRLSAQHQAEQIVAPAASSQINSSIQNPSTSLTPSTSAATNQTSTQPQTTNQAPGPSENTSSNTQSTNKGPTYGELGIITERPKRFEYAVRATRYASFGPWPRDHHLKKEDLADAGFYYAGYGDCARCFYCGGGLRNWEDNDNVWVEHARWFPKCAYIRQTMGQQFVDTVQDLNKSHDQINLELVKEKMGTIAAAFHLDTLNQPLKRDPAVLTVLDLGYGEADVYQAAVYVKETYGTLSADRIFQKLKQDRKPNSINQAAAEVEAVDQTSDIAGDEMVMDKLKEDIGQLRQQTVCKICMDKEVAVVFLPCGHFVSCTDCAAAMKDCPVCRKQVRGIVRAFIG